MNRYLRWASNGAATFSAVLLLTTCVLWFGSYNFAWTRSITIAGRAGPNSGIEDETEMGWRIASDRGILHIEPFYSFFYWDTPYWKLFLLWFVVPARWFVPWHSLSRRKRRISAGL